MLKVRPELMHKNYKSAISETYQFHFFFSGEAIALNLKIFHFYKCANIENHQSGIERLKKKQQAKNPNNENQPRASEDLI